MATSITYKGSELASFSNNMKTLKTAGKYLEGDIVVANTITTQSKSTTVIPSESSQTITLTPDSGKDGLSSAAVTINGITSTYVGSNVPTQGATTITPSSSTQTIASNRYLTGAITVNPIPSQYIVPSGTYTISSINSTTTFDIAQYAYANVSLTNIVTYYTGSSAPTNSLGNDGDIYLQTV